MLNMILYDIILAMIRFYINIEGYRCCLYLHSPSYLGQVAGGFQRSEWALNVFATLMVIALGRPCCLKVDGAVFAVFG